jgi:HAD-hyrolase-like
MVFRDREGPARRSALSPARRAVERAKPGRGIVERALGESGTNRAHAVMVGDTVWDVIAARRAAVPCIGVLSGGIAREPLRDAGAVEVYVGAAVLLDKLGTRAIGRLVGGQRPDIPVGGAALRIRKACGG